MVRTTAETLEFLLGSFVGAEHMYPSTWAPAGEAESTSDASAEVGGSVVVQRYRQRRDGDESFALHAVWSTDPESGEILHWGFDSAGFPPDPPARGSWQGSDLVLDRSTARGSSRLVVTRDADGWSWAKAFRAVGATAWTPVQRASFHPAG